MAIIFIAVQCFQCSTMQVKQQKKSSNKWTCVICNEKQSVRKIHARGHQAKDVRSFVQGFNASRSEGGRSDGSGWISPRSDRRSDGGQAADEEGGEGRRTDWSEYLDPKGDAEREEGEEGGWSAGPMVTTEMPPNKFGRTSPKCPSRPRAASEITNLKPKSSNKRQNETLKGNCGSVKCSRTGMQRAASKWSRYMDKEDEDDGEDIGSKFGDEIGILDKRGTVLNGLIVEEEVHPDFI